MEDLNGTKVFSKIDLKDAYTQIPLKEQSRKMTNFTTDFGTYRFKRLIYGINDAGDFFQQCLHSKLGDLPEVKCIADDIIVYSKSMSDHKNSLKRLFTRLQENGFKINPTKCVLGATEISFYGVIFNEQGVSADPQKIECLKNVKPPTCQQ